VSEFWSAGGDMKKILTLVLFGSMISIYGYADVEQTKVQPNTGTSAVDDEYVDELHTKKSAIERNEPVEVDKTWNGQSQTYSKEDDQKMEEIKDEPGGEDMDGSVWDHRGRK
jgi:hypothetical protein